MGPPFPTPLLTPVLAPGTPRAGFPLAVPEVLRAILAVGTTGAGAGILGRERREAVEEEEEEEEEGFLAVGDGSLLAWPAAEEGEASRLDEAGEDSRLDAGGGASRLEAGEASRLAPVEEAEEGLALLDPPPMPPVDARLDLGGGSRLLPASVGLEGGLVMAVAAVVAPDDANPPVSRWPSAVFFRARGA